MKTTISLPDSLFEAADRAAKSLGMSRNEFFAAAIKEYLQTHLREGVTEALNRIYREVPSRLEPVVAALQGASLPREEW